MRFSSVFPTCGAGAGAGGVMYLAQGIFEGSTTQTTTDRSNKYFSFHFLSMFGPFLYLIIGDKSTQMRKDGQGVLIVVFGIAWCCFVFDFHMTFDLRGFYL